MLSFVTTYVVVMHWKSCGLVVAKTALDRKVMGSNPTSILDGSGVKATQVWLIHPDWFFLDASNDYWTNRVSGSKKNLNFGTNLVFLRHNFIYRIVSSSNVVVVSTKMRCFERFWSSFSNELRMFLKMFLQNHSETEVHKHVVCQKTGVSNSNSHKGHIGRKKIFRGPHFFAKNSMKSLNFNKSDHICRFWAAWSQLLY